MKRSLNERIYYAKSRAKPNNPAAELSLAEYLHGAGLLSGTKYQDWLAKKLSLIYRYPAERSYCGLVAHACSLIDSEDSEDEGIELLYRLIIEPFALIRQNTDRKEIT